MLSLNDAHTRIVQMPEIAFVRKLTEQFFEGGIAVDVMSDMIRAMLFGGVVSIGNVLFNTKKETKQLQKLKEYLELMKLKDTIKNQDGEIKLDTSFVDNRIRDIEKHVELHEKATTYRKYDKLFSHICSFLAITTYIVQAIIVSQVGYVSIFTVIAAMNVYSNQKVGLWIAEKLDIPIVRHLSQFFISFMISFLFVIVSIVLTAVAMQPKAL